MPVQLTASRQRLPRYPAFRGSRIESARELGEIIAAAIGTVVAIARRMRARYRRQREARAVRDALHSLDDHALRDLGFHRSEIGSIAAEMTGTAERTRIRVPPAAHGASL